MSNPCRMERMMETWGTRKQNRKRKKKVISLEKKKKSVIGVSLVQEELPDLGSNEMEVEQSLV